MNFKRILLIYILIFLLASCHEALAYNQFTDNFHGTRMDGMGGVNSMLKDGIISAYYNPAGIIISSQLSHRNNFVLQSGYFMNAKTISPLLFGYSYGIKKKETAGKKASDTEIVFDEKVDFIFPKYENRLKNAISCEGQKVFTKGKKYKYICVLAISYWGDYKGTVKLNYGDTTKSADLNISNHEEKAKFNELKGVYITERHGRNGNVDSVSGMAIFFQTIKLDPDKKLKSFVLPQQKRMLIFSITLIEADTGNFEFMDLRELYNWDHITFEEEPTDTDSNWYSFAAEALPGSGSLITVGGDIFIDVPITDRPYQVLGFLINKNRQNINNLEFNYFTYTGVFAMALGRYMNIGLSCNILSGGKKENDYNTDFSGWNIEIGMVKKQKKWNFGMVWKRESEMKWDEEGNYNLLPTTFCLGASYDLLDSMLIAMEYQYINDLHIAYEAGQLKREIVYEYEHRLRLGLEQGLNLFNRKIFLRQGAYTLSGKNGPQDDDNEKDKLALTLGAGTLFGLAKIDFAFSSIVVNPPKENKSTKAGLTLSLMI